MASIQNNPVRIGLDLWLARFGSVFAWFWMIFWIMLGLVGLGEMIGGKASEPVDFVMPFVSLALGAAHLLLLRACRKTKKLIADFRLYCAVFAREPDKSVPDLAGTLGISLEEAMGRLQEMCRRGYFNGYIDHQKQRMQFYAAEDQQNLYVAYCPGCGAKTAIQQAGDACRYCGAPLHL